ncbi:KH domain-containing protein [Colletotrichum somersetense]|nr:KH domain-containing protein [Colletotrichum somersetense]
MAEPPRDISSILAALGAAQRGTSSTPAQGQPGMPPGYPPPPGGQPPPSYPPMPQQSAPPYAGGYPGLPQPSASGSLDLSSIRPVNSGTVSIADAIAQAKAFAAEKGVTSYDRPIVYSNEPPRGPDSRGYSRTSRSRSPSNRRDQFRDNFNPYRDERRGDERPAGRDYGHGRERSYSPNPRGNTFSPRNPSGRERSPLRGSGGGGGDDNAETIQIESSLVGLIIGRQGENLRRIESESTCRVQFLPSTDNGPFRQCKITGPRARRSEVKEAINRIIEDSGMGAINRGAANPKGPAPRDHRGGPPGAAAAAAAGAAALRDGEDCMQIMVPDRTVGLIIGRGGETIRDLQERSGCHINIVGESKSVNGLRPVNLIGSRESAAQAKDLIMEIVESDSRNDGQPVAPSKKPPRQDGGHQRDSGPGGGPDKIHDAIYVPSEAVGMIIGKGGETIRDMQNGTGCKINVAQSSGPGEVQREIALIGSRDSITRAKQAIEEKVDAVRQKNSGGGGGGGGGGRGRQNQDYDRSYSQQASNPPAPGSTNQPAAQAPVGADGTDPYAQYGGYQNYLALWYQSLVYQQQQGGAAGQPGQPGSQPPPGSS